jgi:hypothetical protein
MITWMLRHPISTLGILALAAIMLVLAGLCALMYDDLEETLDR